MDELTFTDIEEDTKEKNLILGALVLGLSAYVIYVDSKMLMVGLDSIMKYLDANRKIREERMFTKIKKGGEKCEEDLV